MSTVAQGIPSSQRATGFAESLYSIRCVYSGCDCLVAVVLLNILRSPDKAQHPGSCETPEALNRLAALLGVVFLVAAALHAGFFRQAFQWGTYTPTAELVFLCTAGCSDPLHYTPRPTPLPSSSDPLPHRLVADSLALKHLRFVPGPQHCCGSQIAEWQVSFRPSRLG